MYVYLCFKQILQALVGFEAAVGCPSIGPAYMSCPVSKDLLYHIHIHVICNTTYIYIHIL